jgi:hypothetical protein
LNNGNELRHKYAKRAITHHYRERLIYTPYVSPVSQQVFHQIKGVA